MFPKVFAVIPTYNEAENISPLINKILNTVPGIEIVVVDDDSPDGTWRIVSEEFRNDPQVHLLHRKTDRGRGKAGTEGFKYALRNGADYIIEMDADFSHDPKSIPNLLDSGKDADLVIGSRYVKGGRDCRKGIKRRIISKLARIYLKLILGINIEDPTSGFRCFKKEILYKTNLDTLNAEDQFIVCQSLYRCHKKNAKIVEVPIIFRDRGKGTSKLKHQTLLKYLWKVIKLRFTPHFL